MPVDSVVFSVAGEYVSLTEEPPLTIDPFDNVTL